MNVPEAGRGRRDAPSHPGISPQTLIIASVASAAASFAVARIWGPGTLLGAAAAPVIVALVSELLGRPMRTVAATAKRVPADQVNGRGRDHRHGVETPEPLVPPTPAAAREAAPAAPPPGGADAGPRARRRRWGLALATGIAAFGIVVGVYTVPDLIAGISITGNGAPTTFFGGAPTVAKKSTTSTTATSARPTTTITKTSPVTVTKTASSSTTTTTAATAGTTSPTTPSGTQSVTTATSTTVSTVGVSSTAAP